MVHRAAGRGQQMIGRGGEMWSLLSKKEMNNENDLQSKNQSLFYAIPSEHRD